MKIGDTVRIKKGLTGEGVTGVIEKISPWSLNSPYPDLRENFYWLLLEDGIRYHYHGSVLEEITEVIEKD